MWATVRTFLITTPGNNFHQTLTPDLTSDMDTGDSAELAMAVSSAREFLKSKPSENQFKWYLRYLSFCLYFFFFVKNSNIKFSAINIIFSPKYATGQGHWRDVRCEAPVTRPSKENISFRAVSHKRSTWHPWQWDQPSDALTIDHSQELHLNILSTQKLVGCLVLKWPNTIRHHYYNRPPTNTTFCSGMSSLGLQL